MMAEPSASKWRLNKKETSECERIRDDGLAEAQSRGMSDQDAGAVADAARAAAALKTKEAKKSAFLKRNAADGAAVAEGAAAKTKRVKRSTAARDSDGDDVVVAPRVRNAPPPQKTTPRRSLGNSSSSEVADASNSKYYLRIQRALDTIFRCPLFRTIHMEPPLHITANEMEDCGAQDHWHDAVFG